MVRDAAAERRDRRPGRHLTHRRGGPGSRSTQAWWPRLASSTAQLIVLKPVVALVFCVGLSLTGKSSDIETLLSGMLVLVLAVIAWPAVARFFTFASVQVGGSAGRARCSASPRPARRRLVRAGRDRAG